ncbi:hypothetical protein POVWA2_001680 [Plasmodium ovale wallikeri]|uniref:Uncharacterized protein n=1 Tax=Plasmodium ovale wallikeri TaxID=864142 RepID=A0A1A8YHE8_PLAOA|nr:hypothetical protein POVWA2_001680 [Plasmodium ovale wallikeri]
MVRGGVCQLGKKKKKKKKGEVGEASSRKVPEKGSTRFRKFNKKGESKDGHCAALRGTARIGTKYTNRRWGKKKKKKKKKRGHARME